MKSFIPQRVVTYHAWFTTHPLGNRIIFVCLDSRKIQRRFSGNLSPHPPSHFPFSRRPSKTYLTHAVETATLITYALPKRWKTRKNPKSQNPTDDVSLLKHFRTWDWELLYSYTRRVETRDVSDLLWICDKQYISCIRNNNDRFVATNSKWQSSKNTMALTDVLRNKTTKNSWLPWESLGQWGRWPQCLPENLRFVNYENWGLIFYFKIILCILGDLWRYVPGMEIPDLHFCEKHGNEFQV